MRVAFLGTYLPRRCGIATFTHDLRHAVAGRLGDTACPVIAMNDAGSNRAYPDEVVATIAEEDPQSYENAAETLNRSGVDALCIQHEYGIFGGEAGAHLLTLLRALRLPVVTTLHTLLRSPDPAQRRVLQAIIERSDRLVVMTERSRTFLREIYGAPEAKIELVAHGIPDVPFEEPDRYKEIFAVEGRLVLLTFGLLSPNKGIEHVLAALPAIIAEFPQVVYLVPGATHPNLVREQGETYRRSLERLAKQHGVEQHVIFYDRFVDLPELTNFIGAADVYVTPYLNEQQIVSGTLAYAFGAGKAVVSTPYWHAAELLADGRGCLVPFGDAAAIAREVRGLLRDANRRQAMRRRAYEIGRGMVWDRSAARYIEIFGRARSGHGRPHPPSAAPAPETEPGPRALPAPIPDHVLRLTDSTGMLQHALFSVPNLVHGYCTDDNARALLLMLLWEELGVHTAISQSLATRYLGFLAYALNPATGRFRNFLGYDRRWLEDEGSEDSHGRALWALGTCSARARERGQQLLARRLFAEALPAVASLVHPRTWAFCLLGIDAYLRSRPDDQRAQDLRTALIDRLMRRFAEHSRDDWHWLADDATYDNARLPHALLACGLATDQPGVLATGLRSLRWLVRLQNSPHGRFQPIGSNGFCHRTGSRAYFDQQPIEAQATVSACLEAYRATGDNFWLNHAHLVFEWFLGRNDLGLTLYDAQTGGCRDALHVDRANENQGAESTLAFHLALAELRLVRPVPVPATRAHLPPTVLEPS